MEKIKLTFEECVDDHGLSYEVAKIDIGYDDIELHEDDVIDLLVEILRWQFEVQKRLAKHDDSEEEKEDSLKIMNAIKTLIPYFGGIKMVEDVGGKNE